MARPTDPKRLKHTPACPDCGLKDVEPAPGAGNIGRGLFNFLTIILAETDVAPMRWRCKRDGTEFSARGSTIEEP